MTTDDDLATWGEPPAGPGEEDLARRCDLFLERLDRGLSVPDDSPLARVVLWMYHCGTTLREIAKELHWNAAYYRLARGI